MIEQEQSGVFEKTQIYAQDQGRKNRSITIMHISGRSFHRALFTEFVFANIPKRSFHHIFRKSSFQKRRHFMIFITRIARTLFQLQYIAGKKLKWTQDV